MTEIVRLMTTSDINDCAKIFVDAYQEIYSEPWTVETAEARLLELYHYAPDFCFVLTINDDVSGFLVARPFSWYDGVRVWAEEMVVEKSHRGRGFGRLLIQAFLEKCRNESVVGVSLLSRRDSIAFKIYRKMGLQRSDWVHLETKLKELPYSPFH